MIDIVNESSHVVNYRKKNSESLRCKDEYNTMEVSYEVHNIYGSLLQFTGLYGEVHRFSAPRRRGRGDHYCK